MDRAILAALDTSEDGYNVDASLDELAQLAQTAGAETIAIITQKRDKPDAATVFGEGKIEELRDLCEKLEANIVIFDIELSASRVRNIEKIIKTRVIDRTILILDIFAARAVTAEGKKQVELAQLKYTLPRLIGAGLVLSRLGGGIGTRGPGETQLETDRRHIRRRIEKLTSDLAELAKRREFGRTRRRKDGALVCAIAGYTNAGKSTLLNALTERAGDGNAGVTAEDKLFCTLDTTTRAVTLPDGRDILVSDTVGLIRRLPHRLVEAFKSTLEEAASADIILHVCDASDPEVGEKQEATAQVLAELDCGAIPTLLVYNKIDALQKGEPVPKNVIGVSAKSGLNIDLLLQKIAQTLPKGFTRLTLKIPFANAGLLAEIRERGKVFSEEYEEDGVKADANVALRLMDAVEKYVVKEI